MRAVTIKTLIRLPPPKKKHRSQTRRGTLAFLKPRRVCALLVPERKKKSQRFSPSSCLPPRLSPLRTPVPLDPTHLARQRLASLSQLPGESKEDDGFAIGAKITRAALDPATLLEGIAVELAQPRDQVSELGVLVFALPLHRQLDVEAVHDHFLSQGPLDQGDAARGGRHPLPAVEHLG